MNVEVKNGKVYNEEGEVAVLISYGYGAGWSTQGEGEDGLFTPEVVLALINGEDLTNEFLDSVYGKDAFYYGGAKGLVVEWIEEGTLFRVTEYDGAERLQINYDLDWNVA